MGLLRTLLAISVVLNHSPWLDGHAFVGGRNAVQIFYMISGFLMAHVLCFGRRYADVGSFYKNRWLRIAPAYYVMAALSLATFLAFNPDFVDLYRHVPLAADLILGVTNATIIGQDVVMYLGTAAGHLHFVSDFHQSDDPLYRGLLIVPSWTLSLEFCFYLLAPFILSRRGLLFGLLAASVLVRLELARLGLAGKDPWIYRFFPAELALFLLGAVARLHVAPRLERLRINAKLPWLPGAVAATLAVVVVIFPWLPGSNALRSVVLLVVAWLTLPLLFLHQARSAFDKHVGEYSYPIYIGHAFMLWWINYWGWFQQAPVLHSFVNVAAALLFSFVLKRLVIDRVEGVRERYRRPNAPDSATALGPPETASPTPVKLAGSGR